MTLTISEVIKDRKNVRHQFYKGKTVTLIFTSDSGVYTAYGGTEKTVVTRVDIKALVNPVTDKKVWGPVAFMGDSLLHMQVWEGFDTEMLNQFYKEGSYDNIKVQIDELYYRVHEMKSPESWDDEIPYWHLLLQKLETRVAA